MSRNPHLPTDETRKMVRRLSSLGTPQGQIAVMVGCSEKTLRLHYRGELDEGLQDAKAAVLQALMGNIKAGNVTAMIFYDKCRGGQPETIKEEITGLGGGPVVFIPPVTITPACPERECDGLIKLNWERELRLWRELESIDDDIRKVQKKIEELKGNAQK